jgi:peptidoglycan/xylan/chitin deacetylase (PgdA/CDA1 family)
MFPNVIDVLAVAGLSAPAAYFSPWFWRQYRMGAVRKAMVENRMLALTYDDGPSGLTPRLLDLLREHNTRATFFMLGRHAQQHAEIVDRVVKEGHEIGCHTNEHLDAWKTLPWKSVADIDAGYERLSPWVQPNAMFRPPYGKMTLATTWSIRQRKAPVWWWTIDSGDTHAVLPQPAQVAEKVRQAGGGIVLLHDLDRTRERNEFVLETTASLLDLAKRESLQVMSLREICQ